MALASTGVWEVRTGGSDDNGGYFNPAAAGAGTDYTLQDAAQIVIDGATITGVLGPSVASRIELSGVSITSALIGNSVQITGGDATPGIYAISGVDTGGNYITIDRTAGSVGQSVEGNIGGALATPGAAASNCITGNQIWIKSGVYTITTSTPGPSGPFSVSLSNCRVRGYQTTRGDDAANAVLNAGAISSVTLWSFVGGNSNYNFATCLEADGNSQASVNGFSISSTIKRVVFCTAHHCVQGFNSFGAFCYAYNCTTGFGGGSLFCVSEDCTTGFSGVGAYTHCLSIDCTTGFSLTTVSGSGSQTLNCTAVGGNTGFSVGNGSLAMNCLAANCATVGFAASGSNMPSRGGNAVYNCTAGESGTWYMSFGTTVTLSVDPFVNAAGGDYRLNDTATGGADIRGASYGGIPGQTNHFDIGALQHEDPAGGGGGLSAPLIGGCLVRS